MVNASSTGHFDTLVDAETGEVVRRVNLVKFAGQALLFDNYPGAVTGGTSTLKSLTPYLNGGATTLSGPNVHAFADIEDEVPGAGATPDFTPPASRETPPSVGTDFLYPFGDYVTTDYDCGVTFRCSWDPKTPLSWASDSNQAATQLFYYVNVFHDHLANDPGIGFTRRARGQLRPRGGAGPGRRRHAGRSGRHRRLPRRPARQQRQHAGPAARPERGHPRRAHADVPVGPDPRRRPRRAAELPAGPRRRRPVARLPRVHARAEQPAGHGRARLRRAERRPGGRDRRGDGRLVRPRLPGGRRDRAPICPTT